MPSRVLSALRFGLGNSPNTTVDALGSDGLTPLALSAICGKRARRAAPRGGMPDVCLLKKCLERGGADDGPTHACTFSCMVLPTANLQDGIPWSYFIFGEY